MMSQLSVHTHTHVQHKLMRNAKMGFVIKSATK